MFVPPKSRFRIYGGAAHYMSVARDVVLGRTESGDAVEQLEQKAAAFLAARHALAMPQARVGIYLALKALIQPGQDVVLSPYTIYDVVNMVISAGGRPVFADIDRETCNISAAQIRMCVTDRTGAVMVTHLHGLACDIEDIAQFCGERQVPLVEDTSQAFGGRVGGKRLGTFGQAGIYSFGMAKNVNSFYGGLVVTGDRALHARLRADVESFRYQSTDLLMKRVIACLAGDTLTWRPVFDAATFWIYRYGHLHGIDAITDRWRGEDAPVLRRTIPDGSLRKMTPMQARLVLRTIDEIDAQARVRVAHARAYHEGLRDIADILLPPLRDDGSHIYLSFPIQVPDRDALLRFLVEHGRDLTLQHIGNAADYACFSEFQRDCPNARLTAAQVLLLPTYPSYGIREVGRNVRAIRRFFAR
jgi:dTDP-4-amino-4,6-dideoxygalactose transaminase